MEVFFEIPCLTESSSALSGVELIKKYFRKSDRRVPVDALQKFVDYNSDLFSFLGVTPLIYGSGANAALKFCSSNYIGAIPLRAPDSGKQIGDFFVSPRFVGRNKFEEYVQLLDLLEDEINPEFVNSLPLASGMNFRPPLYLEAVKFVGSFEKLINHPWRRFETLESTSDDPSGQIDWRRYVTYEFDPIRRLHFPKRKNSLSETHREFAQLRFIFDVCRRELTSHRTPLQIKRLMIPKLLRLEQRMKQVKPEPTDSVRLRSADRPDVTTCKIHGNRVLQNSLVDATAWRIDFNDVFEKFVQFLFRQLAHSIGGRLSVNPHFKARSSGFYAWELTRLEPDAILRLNEMEVFIDAKYKSHLFNRKERSEQLKTDFRRDLHQALAYSAFASSNEKVAILCYPASEIKLKRTVYRNNENGVDCILLILGLPLRRNVIPEATRALSENLSKLRVFYDPPQRAE